MQKVDYNKRMKEIISGLNGKPKLLLHSCCAPCSSSVLSTLQGYFDITVFFYNPNMDTEEEFVKRQNEEIRLIENLNRENGTDIKIVTCEYNKDEYLSSIKGLEECEEGGKRCERCFLLRLEKTCQQAKQNNFDFFSTTLSVSPYKNSETLNKIGHFLEEKHNMKYLYSDFKKEDGYKKSIELSKKYDLYRQNYCGCEFSRQEREKVENSLTKQ